MSEKYLSRGVFAPATTERILEVYGNPKHYQYNPKLAAALRRRPDIKEDPIFLAGAVTPDTREESYSTVMHEATHRGFKNLGDQFGEGWLNAETEEFRIRYGIRKADVEEIIVRLIDNINEGHNANADMVIRQSVLAASTKKTLHGVRLENIFPVKLRGSNLSEQMLADPMVSDLIRRLQGQADLQTQHEGRPEGATRFAGGPISETSDKPPPPEVRTTGPRDRLVAWRGRKKKPIRHLIFLVC